VPKFPEPPGQGELAARCAAVFAIVPRGSLLWRIYRRGGAHPTRWHDLRFGGPLRGMRFDHQEEAEFTARTARRGILYAAAAVSTCVAEVFQETRFIDASRGEPWLVAFELRRTVRLLDLRGRWPTAAGASMAINSGPRDRARRWSRRIYEDYPAVEGLWYPSSMDANRPAVALYERAENALPTHPAFHHPLSDPSLRSPLAAVAGELKYLLP
jgi:hypothetical protein